MIEHSKVIEQSCMATGFSLCKHTRFLMPAEPSSSAPTKRKRGSQTVKRIPNERTRQVRFTVFHPCLTSGHLFETQVWPDEEIVRSLGAVWNACCHDNVHTGKQIVRVCIGRYGQCHDKVLVEAGTFL